MSGFDNNKKSTNKEQTAMARRLEVLDRHYYTAAKPTQTTMTRKLADS